MARLRNRRNRARRRTLRPLPAKRETVDVSAAVLASVDSADLRRREPNDGAAFASNKQAREGRIAFGLRPVAMCQAITATIQATGQLAGDMAVSLQCDLSGPPDKRDQWLAAVVPKRGECEDPLGFPLPESARAWLDFRQFGFDPISFPLPDLRRLRGRRGNYSLHDGYGGTDDGLRVVYEGTSIQFNRVGGDRPPEGLDDG